MRLVYLAVAAWLLLAGAQGALADDLDALALADQTPKAAAPLKTDWHCSIEGAYAQTARRYAAGDEHSWRASVDVQYERPINESLRLTLADRLDIVWDQASQRRATNTLKEGYVTWRPDALRMVDLGRVNARYGVAYAYNPTDYFRSGALRSVVSIDPVSLRNNRLGSVMLRGQQLWDTSSLTVIYAPKLAEGASDAPFNPDLGATNGKNRWLVSFSHKLSNQFAPQWLLYSEAHQAPQLGFNLTSSINDATIAYAEWSGGRSRSIWSQALGQKDDTAFRSRLALGFTYTTTADLSFTLESEHNGAGLDRDGWAALSAGPPDQYGQYRFLAQYLQDPPARQSLFMNTTWHDVVLKHFDLMVMLRFNQFDRSHLAWLEGRYHWDHVDLALQWHVNSGRAGSEFGALPQHNKVQSSLTYFF